MRIIKAAKKIDEITTTCSNCKSILGIRESDLEWKCNANAWAYTCPVCDAKNKLEGQKTSLFSWIMEEEAHEKVPSGDTMREHTL